MAESNDCMVFWDGDFPKPREGNCGYNNYRVDFDVDFQDGDAVLYVSKTSLGWQIFDSSPYLANLPTPLSCATYVSNDGNGNFFCSQTLLSLNQYYTQRIACDGSDQCIGQAATTSNPAATPFIAVFCDPCGHAVTAPYLQNQPICIPANAGGTATQTTACFSTATQIAPSCDIDVSNWGSNACTPFQVPNDCCVNFGDGNCKPN